MKKKITEVDMGIISEVWERYRIKKKSKLAKEANKRITSAIIETVLRMRGIEVEERPEDVLTDIVSEIENKNKWEVKVVPLEGDGTYWGWGIGGTWNGCCQSLYDWVV